MSTKYSDYAIGLALSIVCPVCEASPGECCTRVRPAKDGSGERAGAPLTPPHERRIRIAMARR